MLTETTQQTEVDSLLLALLSTLLCAGGQNNTSVRGQQADLDLTIFRKCWTAVFGKALPTSVTLTVQVLHLLPPCDNPVSLLCGNIAKNNK